MPPVLSCRAVALQPCYNQRVSAKRRMQREVTQGGRDAIPISGHGRVPGKRLEIDLLRAGTRIQLAGEPPPAPYYVYLSRWQHRPWTEIWPISLREPLPTVPVPLLPPDPDVPLDLQAAVKACFDLVGYERLLDYNRLHKRQPELSEAEARRAVREGKVWK